MSAGVGGIGSSGPVQLQALAVRGAAAPARPSPTSSSSPVSLPEPEEQAFKVATINQRLASIAAARSGEPGPTVDITA